MKRKRLSILLALALACMSFGMAVLAEDGPEEMAVLYADWSYGAADPLPEQLEQYELGYSGELTGEMLAEGLTALTGLDFFVTVTPGEGFVAVDWAADSTLIANLDDREQNEHFQFFDADSMRWFMMDSLYRTLMENLGVIDVYYTMQGGQELSIEGLSPVSTFPADAPYFGSAVYFGNDGRGDLFDEEIGDFDEDDDDMDDFDEDEIFIDADIDDDFSDGPVLVGTFPKDAELVEDKAYEGSYQQVLLYDDLFSITTLRQPLDDEYPMEMSIEEFIMTYFMFDELPGLERVGIAPVAAYPTERVRFQIGEDEDASMNDMVLIRTDAYYFAFIAHTTLDVYEGYVEGYAAGDAADLFDAWAESLGLFDPAA